MNPLNNHSPPEVIHQMRDGEYSTRSLSHPPGSRSRLRVSILSPRFELLQEVREHLPAADESLALYRVVVHFTYFVEVRYDLDCTLPELALKYIVAHEVAHIFNKRRIKRFWKTVKMIYPNYELGQNLLLNFDINNV